MELARLFEELTLAAERVGIAVRLEPFDAAIPERVGGRGGLCTVRGRRVILVDARAPLPDRIATIAASLAAVDLEGVFVPPIVRATIGVYRTGPAALRAPPSERRPIARARGRDR
jgi:hypothetical protein